MDPKSPSYAKNDPKVTRAGLMGQPCGTLFPPPYGDGRRNHFSPCTRKRFLIFALTPRPSATKPISERTKLISDNRKWQIRWARRNIKMVCGYKVDAASLVQYESKRQYNLHIEPFPLTTAAMVLLRQSVYDIISAWPFIQ